MNIRRHGLIFSLVLLIAACQAGEDQNAANGDATDGTDTAADAAAQLDALRASYEEHYDLGHADMVADMYVEDAVALQADGDVLRGREAIAADLTEALQGSPDLALEQFDAIVGDSIAVTVGAWDVTVTPAEGAEPRTHGGHYMTANGRTADGWALLGVITNHDSQQPAEMLQGTAGERPPEQSQMGALIEAYEEAWNAGDPEAVAALYTEDAWAAFADLPAVEGREAVADLMEQRVRGEIEIHGVRSESLGDGRMVDGGWYRISGGETGDFVGNYWIVTETVNGEPKIKWAVNNGRPASVIPSSSGV